MIRWDPWSELSAWERQLNSLFGRSGRSNSGSSGEWAPALDVHQEGDTMVICAEVPGVDPKELDISVENDVLTVSGSRDDHREVKEGEWIRRERFSGQFQRSVRLPPGVDPQSIQATANNGVVRITVPKAVTSGRHRVELSSGAGTSSVDVTAGGSAEGAGQATTGNGGGSGNGGATEAGTGSATAGSTAGSASEGANAPES